jgi:uncharacterized protein YfdQ (DUF2303 family)
VLIQTKGQQNINFTLRTDEKSEKAVKTLQITQKHLHSEKVLKKFKEVHQLWLPKSHLI